MADISEIGSPASAWSLQAIFPTSMDINCRFVGPKESNFLEIQTDPFQ